MLVICLLLKRKVILLLALPLILCGCSSKTMTCSGTSEGDKRVTTQEYVLEYKKDTVTNVSQITTNKFDDKETLDIYVKAFDSYVTSLLDVASQASGYMLVETKITKDNSYIIKIDAEIEKCQKIIEKSSAIIEKNPNHYSSYLKRADAEYKLKMYKELLREK